MVVAKEANGHLGLNDHFAKSSLLGASSVTGRSWCVRYAFYIGVFAGIFLLFVFIYGRSSSGDSYRLYYTWVRSQAGGVDESCTLPRPDPFDPTILKYVTKPQPLQCKRLQAELTYVDWTGWLCMNATELAAAQYSLDDLQCTYRCFDKKMGDDVTLTYGEWTPFRNCTQLRCEFVETSCSTSGFALAPIYSNLHAQVIVNETLVEHLRTLRPQKGAARSPPSVLLFVLDSVSHLNFVRALPNTLRTLRDELGAIVFDGLVKIADNSFPNAIGFLTGKRVLQPGYQPELQEDMTQSFFDDWPFVWNEFAQQGYLTFYAEDYPNYNLFQYLSNGFRYKPVHHYMRPFWHALWPNWLHRRSTHLCFGNTPKHRLQLNYLRQFVAKYRKHDVPYFALSWLTELGHDYLNQVGLGDDDLAQFFRDLAPYLNNTLLFVFSDHGHRFDAIRESVIGRTEERMPFFSVRPPPHWNRELSEVVDNLRNNSQVLTSFFDLYATLQDLRVWTSESASASSSNCPLCNSWEYQRNLSVGRGQSMLRPIDGKRSCEEAGIPEDFCVCQHETVVNVTDEKALAAGLELVRHLNGLLRANYAKQCAELSMKEIRNAQTFLPNMRMVLDPQMSVLFGGKSPSGFYVNYRVTVQAAPSDALFEGTLKNTLQDGTFTVIGDVNRINRYGNQSECIPNAFLRKYCYCIE